MDYAFSSILDLTHKHQEYNILFIEPLDIDHLLYDKCKLKGDPVQPSIATEHWDTIANLAVKRGPFTALKYVSKLQSLESTSETLYRHALTVLKDDGQLINGVIECNTSVSEQDVCSIWFPIIKKLIHIRKIAFMKQKETVNPSTTKRKQASYPDQDQVRGFKVDVRLLLYYDQNEIDLCSGEVARNAKDADKLAHDRSKCLREAKEIVDHQVQAGLGEDAIGWTIQIAGLEAHMMSVHLFREGLHVALPRKK